jgi:UDPglucose--hexose-1-phosphate uridylyltransferase
MTYRFDPLREAVVVIADDRQDRPNLPAGNCPFCVGGLEAPDPYRVRWFPNRWPALGKDRCEVVLFSPEHDGSLWSSDVRAVVDLWAERTLALGDEDDVGYVLVFENRGAEVGATIPHPHGQVYGFLATPPAAQTELEQTRCALCDAPELVVAERGGWRAWVPTAASYPYEVVISPAAHLPDLPSLDDTNRDALAGLLSDVLWRFDQVLGEPMPYMLWVHQHPTDGDEWPLAHVHVHIAGVKRAPGTLRFVAAGEIGSGVYFNPVRPEAAAERLRHVAE